MGLEHELVGDLALSYAETEGLRSIGMSLLPLIAIADKRLPTSMRLGSEWQASIP